MSTMAAPSCACSCRTRWRSPRSGMTVVQHRSIGSTTPDCFRGRVRREPRAIGCGRGFVTRSSRWTILIAFRRSCPISICTCLGEGNHLRLYDKLGAHPFELDGVAGVAFVVFAPNARRVSVVGDFNLWDGRRHAMRVRGNGFWEIFAPGAARGQVQVRHSRAARRGAAAQGRSGRICCGVAAENGIDRRRSREAQSAGSRAARLQCSRCTDLDLRSASRLLAPTARGGPSLAHLSGACRRAAGLRARHELHACGVSAGHRTSVRRLLGLSADRPVCAHQPLRKPGGFCGSGRCLPSRRAWRHPRLGPRAFPRRRPWSWRGSTALRFTSTPTRARAGISIGAR